MIEEHGFKVKGSKTSRACEKAELLACPPSSFAAPFPWGMTSLSPITVCAIRGWFLVARVTQDHEEF